MNKLVDRASRFARIAGLGISMLAASNVAHAGLFDDDEARRAIIDLRSKVEAARQDADQKNADEAKRATDEASQLRTSILDLQNQLEALRTELAKLRGEDEQLAKDLSDLQRKQKDGYLVFEDRLRALEPVKVTVDGQEFLTDPATKRDFEGNLAIFRKGDFANAATGFVDFLTRNPQTGYRPAALFWLGTAQYANKDCKSATTNLRNLITLAPDHMRVPESMLSIANCQLEGKDIKAARKTLEDLVAGFPTSEAAVAAQDRLARFK